MIRWSPSGSPAFRPLGQDLCTRPGPHAGRGPSWHRAHRRRSSPTGPTSPNKAAARPAPAGASDLPRSGARLRRRTCPRAASGSRRLLLAEKATVWPEWCSSSLGEATALSFRSPSGCTDRTHPGGRSPARPERQRPQGPRRCLPLWTGMRNVALKWGSSRTRACSVPGFGTHHLVANCRSRPANLACSR